MDISSLSNFTAVNRFAAGEPNKDLNASETTESEYTVSKGSQSNLIPPPPVTAHLGKEEVTIRNPGNGSRNHLTMVI